MLGVTEILSALTIKRLAVEHDGFLQKNNEFQVSTKLEVTSFYIKIR